jgi:hypothetical protein
MLFLLGLVSAGALFAAGPITDETLRLQVLGVIFPGMIISPLAGRTIDSTRTLQDKHPLVFPDALAAEKVYRVTGLPTIIVEACAAANGPPDRTFMVREVRLQPYPWPAGEGELLAVLQYRFPDAKPSTNCTSIGLLVHLTGEGTKREVFEQLLLDPERHAGLQSVQMADLTGDGRPELVAVASRASTRVKGRAQWTQTLDIPRTLDERGKRFCFMKTV